MVGGEEEKQHPEGPDDLRSLYICPGEMNNPGYTCLPSKLRGKKPKKQKTEDSSDQENSYINARPNGFRELKNAVSSLALWKLMENQANLMGYDIQASQISIGLGSKKT